MALVVLYIVLFNPWLLNHRWVAASASRGGHYAGFLQDATWQSDQGWTLRLGIFCGERSKDKQGHRVRIPPTRLYKVVLFPGRIDDPCKLSWVDFPADSPYTLSGHPPYSCLPPIILVRSQFKSQGIKGVTHRWTVDRQPTAILKVEELNGGNGSGGHRHWIERTSWHPPTTT